jgi:hypothetical protein
MCRAGRGRGVGERGRRCSQGEDQEFQGTDLLSAAGIGSSIRRGYLSVNEYNW